MHWKSSSGRRTASPEGSGAGAMPAAASSEEEGAALLSLAQWADEAEYVRDFLRRYPLPQVARVVKGQYLTLGAPQQLLFLSSTGRRRKVAAQCVKFKEGSRKVVPVGPKLAIPDNYEGWFEILSEEGRAVRQVDSVAELARRFPDSCLVRQPLKAYVARGDDAETITDRVRTVAAGETLVLVSEVVGTSAAAKRPAGRFLRCFDARGDNVYLAFEQRAKFSVVAKEDNIGGVHSIRALLLAKRLPLMVRLVSGKAPVQGKAFVPEMRLYASFDEECVMALPLGGRQPAAMVAVPTAAPLKLQGPRNADALRRAEPHALLGERCRLMVDDAGDAIQVVDAAALARKLPCFRRAFSDPYGCKSPYGDAVLRGDAEAASPPDKEDTRYDEIDQIYDYVRGFAPPPPPEPDGGAKPEPPPIETIPARRAAPPDVVPPAVARIKRAAENVYERIPRKEAEERRRVYVHAGGGKHKLYAKSAAKSRLFRGDKEAAAVKAAHGSVKSSATSPIFNIRYKSLSNLQAALRDLDGGTLDSAGSTGASYILEPDDDNYLRGAGPRLPRPKSLSNLVWELNAPLDCKRANILNSAICRRGSDKGPADAARTKRIGTLYL